MYTLLSIAIVVFVVFLLIQSALLVGTSKLFKISGATYKKSLLIVLGSFVAQFIVVIIFALIVSPVIASVLGVITNITTFCIIIKRNYQITLLKSIGIYVVNSIFTIIAGIVIALFVSLPIRTYVVEPFVVNGSSMSPHYNTGDYMFIKKFGKDFKRDDVIVYRNSAGNAYLIKRIIGLPNENITLSNRVLSINSAPLNDANLVGRFATSTIDVTLGNDEYFVVGDNLEHSALDSITVGPIKASQIIGKIGINLGKIYNVSTNLK